MSAGRDSAGGSDAEKLRIVEESSAAPRLVAATARRHGISRALLTRWRRQAREGLLAAEGDRAHFAPVAVTPNPAPGPVTADARDRAEATGRDRVEIILANGHRFVTTARTEAAVLAQFIQVVEWA
mgnify:CR=1 FL=1